MNHKKYSKYISKLKELREWLNDSKDKETRYYLRKAIKQIHDKISKLFKRTEKTIMEEEASITIKETKKKKEK